MFKRFINDLIRFNSYAIYSAKSILKSEVADSYLNWLWWILDPLCFMLIYSFVFGMVFDAREQYFTAFIFIGLTMWDFFNKTIMQSVRLVKNNKSIVSKVYLPKFILIIVRMYVNGFKMAISFVLIIFMMVLYRVPITMNILFFIPIMLTLIILTFGISTFLLHFGVYVEDLSNVTSLVLRFMFYLTGIFYNVEKRLEKIAPYNILAVRCNPMALLLAAMRDVLLYGTTPDYPTVFVWFFIGIVISILGVRLIYKNENSYVKVV